MSVRVIATTKFGYEATKEDFERAAGLYAGVCYLPETIEKLFSEPQEKTEKRTEMILKSGHHSPFDHLQLTLQFVDVPKIIAMALNNEQYYDTSEKSARYRRMALPEDEQAFYDKWFDIFRKEIQEQVQPQCPERFTENKIGKLAQENARYLTSVFTPTTMVYTLSYRQFNILISLIDKEIMKLQGQNDLFSIRFRNELIDFNDDIKNLPFYNENLASNPKDRNLSLVRRVEYPIIKHFGDVYSIAYEGSFAQLAQAQRHRTLNYQMRLLKEPKFYVPEILKAKPELVEEWLKDSEALADHFPQGMLVEINETGTRENFIGKAKERRCGGNAQKEIDDQTKKTAKEYYQSLMDAGYVEQAKEIEPYTKGSRCTAGFKCPSPCGWKEGVKGERLI
jgi:hypothetical protein